MASPTRWTWVWVNSGSWWWTGRPGMLQFMGLQRVGHDWTELNWDISLFILVVSVHILTHCMRAKLLQSCPTLCSPMDCSPPGFSVHGILQARILEWVAISSSRGSSWLSDWTQVPYVSCTGRRVLYTRTTWEAPSSPYHTVNFFQHPGHTFDTFLWFSGTLNKELANIYTFIYAEEWHIF